jgi:hypothetical protein
MKEIFFLLSQIAIFTENYIRWRDPLHIYLALVVQNPLYYNY